MNSFVDRNGSAVGKGLEQGYLLTGSKENGKKTKKGKTKGKRLANEAKKGFNYSTPSNSDDTDKQRTEQTTLPLEKQKKAQTKVKGQTRRQATKGRKKTKKRAVVLVEPDAIPVRPQDAESDLSSQIHNSLRWEGVLEDPVAEQERIEIYKANRRKRYLAAQRACMHETPAGNARSDLKTHLKKSN